MKSILGSWCEGFGRFGHVDLKLSKLLEEERRRERAAREGCVTKAFVDIATMELDLVGLA